MEIDRQLIYTLHPLRWQEGSEVRRVPAFALVGLPKALLPAALRHQHVDHLNARRVQTLMHLHGSDGLQGDCSPTIRRSSISMRWSPRRRRAHKPTLRKAGVGRLIVERPYQV